jgi:hypothetical protein
LNSSGAGVWRDSGDIWRRWPILIGKQNIICNKDKAQDAKNDKVKDQEIYQKDNLPEFPFPHLSISSEPW